MPLPSGNIAWPPADTAEVNKRYNEYHAWYAGDPEQLALIYRNAPGTDFGLGSELPRGQIGGARFVADVARGVARRFWGSPTSVGQVRQHKVHIPLPADLAMTGADLLYGEPPKHKIVVDDSPTTAARATSNVRVANPTQDALDEIHEDGNTHAVLLESGELGCAYGGSYVRITWDPVVSDIPLWDALPPDCAIPQWRSGQLAAVTLWRDLLSPDGKTWRHLERHEPGRVLHGLYRSTDPTKLGVKLPLEAHDATAPFAMIVDAGDGTTVTTGATGLACEYIPNMRPNRDWRGSPLGRSDYAGVMGLFDQLDEAWTSWMRDLRLGKGRLIVPRSYVQNQGKGRGAVFDADREVYEAVDTLAASAQGAAALQLSVVQFAIRVDEHSRTCREIRTTAQTSAGYSPQTFGDTDTVAATATEVNQREAASFRSRARKITYARGPLQRLDRTALEILANKIGKRGIVPDLPQVTWPDGVAQDQKDVAMTLQLLQAAESASIQTRVRLFNPDWASDEIDREVIRIKQEVALAHAGPTVPDPGSTATGHGMSDPSGTSSGSSTIPDGPGDGPTSRTP